MKTKLLILVLLLLPSCTKIVKRVHLGLGHTDLIANNIQLGGEYTSGISGGALIGPTYKLSESVSADILLGPTIVSPLHKKDERGHIFSLDLAPRIRLTEYEWEPFIGIFFGPGITDNKWNEQKTTWGFVLGTDFGIKKGHFTFGYRFWHESNGATVFGHGRQPNPGFNMGIFTIGVEW